MYISFSFHLHYFIPPDKEQKHDKDDKENLPEIIMKEKSH